MASLPWFKMWPDEMMDRTEWRRLTPELRGLVSIAFSVLGRARSLGRDATVEDLVDYTGYQRRKVMKMLEELGPNPFITVSKPETNDDQTSSKQSFTSGLFDVWQRSKDVTAASRMRKYRDSTRNVTRNVTNGYAIEIEPEVEPEVEKSIVRVADAELTKKPKAVKVREELPAVSFEPEDEARVAALILDHAPSGRVQPFTLARLRNQYRDKLDAVGFPCWRFGVDKALAKPAGWDYALAVMESNPTGAPASRSPSKGASKPERYVPENLRPDLGIIAQLEEAVRKNGVR